MNICQCKSYASCSQTIIDQAQKGKIKTFLSFSIFINWISNFKCNYYV